MSTAAVASSRTRIFDFRSNALARQSSCLCPRLSEQYSLAVTQLIYSHYAQIYLKFSPPSETLCISPSFNSCVTNGFKWDSSRAFHISTSVCSSKGSRFILRLPLKRTGSWIRSRNPFSITQFFFLLLFWDKRTWGIIDKHFLRSCRPMVEMSTPSIRIFPPAASINLNRPRVNDDFPAPVLPTIPICTHRTNFLN